MVPPDPNKPTFSLNLNIKTPEQTWYDTDYPFTMDRDKLLMNSNKSRPDIPRPPNSFILYAKNEGNKPKYKKMQANKKFRIIGKLWLNESNEVKNLFDCGAKVAKKKHAKQHKGYRFRKRNQQKGAKNVKENKLPIQSNLFSTSTTSSTSLEHHPQLQYITEDQYNFSSTTTNFIATANCNQLELSIPSNLESPLTLNFPYIRPVSNFAAAACDLPGYINYNQIETSNPSNLESFLTPSTLNYPYIQSNSNLNAVTYDLPGYPNCDLMESPIPSNLEFFSTYATLDYPYIQPETNLTFGYNLSGLVINESSIVPLG
ncbi:hypothetical protein RhiirA5_460541 [Rhizophagus irregularis]|uniref:MATA-HMG n=2 Tax=Rhizophagus irregularis TaxID=588596 RepID=A0A1B1ETP5_9GLOM|nr:MATA-HMG [Rhizophagus irregularis]EXX52314.1 hypothetical protein RirG_254070 [Rhizophagus irregularis DAOM 197198w]ANQ32182.1 MATA-HMG [Rhizophagus irregularis]ANQ32183.1 MATA-HMG [Rhizophagus irregularis]PKB99847.1 hypothetical protein RhiirA5_460541 [Rhizophagus irregularis]